jgi:hypothetical protein
LEDDVSRGLVKRRITAHSSDFGIKWRAVRMPIRKRQGALTDDEKRIVKALLDDDWRNQDIQALVNESRAATVNSARITGVKQDASIVPADATEVELFKLKKRSYDPTTGLNLYDDERLVRAREAMILAVQVFNGPSFHFKTELFAVLANIAWTYLMHEYYHRKGVKILDADGRSMLLSQILARADCPLSVGIKNNLTAIKTLRDEVEHLLLRKSDFMWAPLFQACCLNFDKMLRTLFDERLSLRKELSFALQFARLDIEQVTTVQKYELSEQIEALDARLKEGLTEDQLADLEYKFRVVYTLDNATKSTSNVQFVHPGSEGASEIRNVLLKYKIADDAYPYKPLRIIKLVSEKTGKRFTSNNHVQAWRLYKVRPRRGAKQPENTNKDYCIYHAAHNDYTYSEKWISFLVEKVNSENEFNKIKAAKL